MSKLGKLLLLGCMTALAGIGLVACGGGSSGGGGTNGGTATVLMGTAPDYLDPQEEYTTQGAEADWISYTPLVTYKHENAPGGNQLIPGLATALPQISQRPEDLHPDPPQGPRVLERPARQGERLQVHGRAHDQGELGRQELRHRQRRRARPTSTRARPTTSRASRPTTPRARSRSSSPQPYGAFSNVLAFPELGLVPCGTPDHTLTTSTAPGRRPVHDHEHRPEQVVQRGQESEVRRAEHPGHPDWVTSTGSTSRSSRTPRRRRSRC